MTQPGLDALREATKAVRDEADRLEGESQEKFKKLIHELIEKGKATGEALANVEVRAFDKAVEETAYQEGWRVAQTFGKQQKNVAKAWIENFVKGFEDELTKSD